MEIYEGYNYRINIVGADSSIIVDSNTGLIRGCVADVNENIMVDTFTNTFQGTLVGSVIDKNLNIIVDIDNNTINALNINSDHIQSNTFQGTLVGSVIDKNLNIIVDIDNNTINALNINSDHIQSNTFQGTLVGSVIDKNLNIIVDIDNNTIKNIDLLETNLIKADNIYGTLIGNICDEDKNIIFDTLHKAIKNLEILEVNDVVVTDSIYGNLKGNIFNKYGDLIFDYNSNKFYLDSVTSIGSNFLLNIFNEYDQEILYTKNTIGFSSSKIYNFKTLFDNNNTFDFDQITILSNSVTEDKNSAGMIGFYGFSDQESIDINHCKFFGSLGFVANYEILESDGCIPADFVVLNGKNNFNFEKYTTGYDYIKDNGLVFDHNGVLSVPIIKTGVHQNNTINNPQKGMIIFNDAIGKFQGYTGTTWVDLH